MCHIKNLIDNLLKVALDNSEQLEKKTAIFFNKVNLKMIKKSTNIEDKEGEKIQYYCILFYINYKCTFSFIILFD